MGGRSAPGVIVRPNPNSEAEKRKELADIQAALARLDPNFVEPPRRGFNVLRGGAPGQKRLEDIRGPIFGPQEFEGGGGEGFDRRPLPRKTIGFNKTINEARIVLDKQLEDVQNFLQRFGPQEPAKDPRRQRRGPGRSFRKTFLGTDLNPPETLGAGGERFGASRTFGT